MDRIPILKENEEKSALRLLDELKKFICHVPVAHYSPPSTNSNGTFDFDKNNLGIEDYFYEDYSSSFYECGELGIDLIRLMKLYQDELKNTIKKKINLLRLFTETIPSEYKDDGYSDFVKTCLTIPEEISKTMWQLLSTKTFRGRFKFESLYEYLYNTFYNEELQRDVYLFSQNKKEQHLFQTVRAFRNKVQHLEGEPIEDERQFGDDNKLFSEPEDSSPDKHELLCYYRNLHLRIALFVVLIFCRFHTQLRKTLNFRDPCGVEEFADDDENTKEAKKHINHSYINKIHSWANKKLSDLFKGVKLENYPYLQDSLPELELRSAQLGEYYDNHEGSSLLSEDLTHRRKLVVGPAGSGKTVMMMRMIMRDQPRLTPFYQSLDNGNIPSPKELWRNLTNQVLGIDLLTMSSDVRDKVVNRLNGLLDDGSAVFFFDSVDASPESIEKILEFIDTYPNCQYILASQPDILNDELKNTLEGYGFIFYETLPLNDNDAKKAARIVSLNFSNLDHSESLLKKINTATYGTGLGRLPFTFMQMAYLFEHNQQANLHRINRSSLNWELIKSIRNNSELDIDERKALLNQPTLVLFRKQLDNTVVLCRDVNSLFNARPQGEWKELIYNFSLVSSGKPEDLQLLFELLQLVDEYCPSQKQQAKILRTLVTVSLLESGILGDDTECSSISLGSEMELSFKDEKLPSPNPMLQVIADAVSLIPDEEPAIGDSMRKSNDSLFWFRLQPNFIVRRYLSTLLTVYQQAKVTPLDNSTQLKGLFESIARMGHKELTNCLFEPFWMRMWLIHKDDKIPNTSFYGYSSEGNILFRILIEKTVNNDEMVFQLIKQKFWIDAWKLQSTTNLLEIYVHDAICCYMNDDQRERLYKNLDTLTDGIVDTDYYKNYIIVSMHNLSLTNLYNVRVNRIPDVKIQKSLMEKGANAQALKLLTLILQQIIRIDPLNFKERNRIVNHIVKYGVPTMQGVSNEFWSFVELMIAEPSYRTSLIEILDSLPIEDIRQDIATKLYDERIYDLQKQAFQEEHRIANKWRANLNPYDILSMFRNVSKESRMRQRIQYSFYCRPTNVTFEIATECIDEMPEQKFCKLRDLNGKIFDQWFKVDDVIVLNRERELSNIAELTINLPTGAPRHNMGKIIFEAYPDDNSVKYIHLFHKVGKGQVIVRIQDQDWIQRLSEEDYVRGLMDNQKVSIGNYMGTLVGIQILPIPPNMRIIRIHAVEDNSLKKTGAVSLLDIPHQGTLSFFNPKEYNSKEIKALSLKSLSFESQASTTTINEMLYLCSMSGVHYVAIKKNVNEGNFLWWDVINKSSKVIDVFAIDTIEVDPRVPPLVKNTYRHNMNHFYADFKRAKKQNKELPEIPFFSQIVAFEFLSYSGNIKKLLKERTMTTDARVRVVFYHPICDPSPISWENTKLSVTLTSVLASKRKIEGKNYLIVPSTDYPSQAKYYYDPFDKKRLPVQWEVHNTIEGKELKCITLDNRLSAVWKEHHFISFFDSIDATESLKIHFGSLTEVIDLKNPQNYHSSITPLLIREWISDRCVDNDRIRFCQSKRYMDMLLYLCYESKIELPSNLQVEIAYVLSVEKDRGSVRLFSQKKIHNSLSIKEVNITDLRNCISNFSGEIPNDLKAGMLVICNKSRLSILNNKLMNSIRSQKKWGFVLGVVEGMRGNRVSIKVNNTNVNFLADSEMGDIRLKKNQEILMFPIINPEKNGCAEAKYIQPII